MLDPGSCERTIQVDQKFRGWWAVYDDPFGSIYRFTGRLFGSLLPGIKDEDVEKFRVIIATGGGENDDWYQDVVSIFTKNSFSTFLLILSLILLGCSLFMVTFLLLRYGYRKIAGPQISKSRENRFQLGFRLMAIFLLFVAILWCEIMYGVALAQMDREQRGLDRDMDDVIEKMDRFHQQLDPKCPFETASMTRDGIIDYFEGLDRDILDKCSPTQAGYDQNGTQNPLLPPAMETMLYSVLEKSQRILALLNASTDSRTKQFMYRTGQQKRWLEQIVSNAKELQKNIRFSTSIPDLENSPVWRIRKQREKILLDAQAKTLLATMDFYNLAEIRIERAGIVEKKIFDWLKGIASTMKKGHLEQLHTPSYNLNYVYYQGTIGAVAAGALLCLAVAFFATLYKLVFIDGIVNLRKQERTVGTLFYVGFFFLAISSGFLCWTLDGISKPAMVLRGSCDALFTDKDFTRNGTSFYGRLPDAYNWTGPIYEKDNDHFPATFSETMDRLQRREGFLFHWDDSSVKNGIAESVKKWIDDLPTILEDLQAAEIYSFKISAVKKIRSAMYGLMYQQERQDGRKRKTTEIYETIEELLSDLAYFDFPLKQNGDFKLLNSNQGNPETPTPRYYYSWDRSATTEAPYYRNWHQSGRQWDRYVTTTPSYYWNGRRKRAIQQNPACAQAVAKYQENIRNIDDKLTRQIRNVTTSYNAIFPESNATRSELDQYLCETLADPASSLLFFYLINMMLWLVATAVLFKIARGWDLGLEKRTTLISSMETISSPLIDSDKLEEAIHNNPMAEI